MSVDYRLGWRWLIPDTSDCVIRVSGFDLDECTLLSQLPSLPTADNAVNNAWIIRDDGKTTASEPKDFHLESATHVSVLTNRKRAGNWRQRLQEQFPHIREYGMLPADNPRIVVPLAEGLTEYGLELHRPGRLLARLGMMAARQLARRHNHVLLRGQQLIVARRDEKTLPAGVASADIADQLDWFHSDVALYLGTADANRKTVVLPLGEQAPRMIIKQAATPRARLSLHREADSLALLADTPLAEQIPRLYQNKETDHYLSVFLEYRRRGREDEQQMFGAVSEFLSHLADVDRRKMPLTDLMPAPSNIPPENLNGSTKKSYNKLLTGLQDLATEGQQLLLHRCHGDFAPWNCSWTEDGLFVYDWEESRSDTLAFSDAFYYSIAPSVEISGRPHPGLLLSETLKLADSIGSRTGVCRSDVRIHLALWLLGRLHQSRIYVSLAEQLLRRWPS